MNKYGKLFGAELSFGQRMRQLLPGTNIALIKYSRGATGLEFVAAEVGCWDPDYKTGNGVNQWDHYLATIRRTFAVDDIDGDGEKDRLIPAGIIWMQGESDAHEKEIALRYQANLKRLMMLMRASLRQDDLPVVIGRISDSGQDVDGKIWDFGEQVRVAQQGFVNQDDHAVLVTSTDGYGYSDKYHYNSAGFIDLGIQFAEAMVALIGRDMKFPNEGNMLMVREKQSVSVGDFRVSTSGAQPKQATRATVSYETNGLAIVFDCTDTGIVGDQHGDDNIKLWKDDSVYIWFDPGHTHHAEHYLMVQVSASGAWLDQRDSDPKYNIEGLDAKVSRTDTGWRAEIRIPWKGLGVPAPQPGDAWSINLTRMDQPGKIDFANMESSSWVALPDGDATALDRWGHLVFVVGTDEVQSNVNATALQAMMKTHEVRQQVLIEKNTR